MRFTVDPAHIVQCWTWDHRSLVALVLFFALPLAISGTARFIRFLASDPTQASE